jgi:hypothetical protein
MRGKPQRTAAAGGPHGGDSLLRGPNHRGASFSPTPGSMLLGFRRRRWDLGSNLAAPSRSDKIVLTTSDGTRSSLYERVFPNRVQETFDDVCLLKFNFWCIWCVLFAQVRSRAHQVLDLVHLVRIGAREILANLTKGVSCSSFALVYLGAFG